LVGERGVVTGTPRSATVRATSHLAAYSLFLERLGGMLDVNPAASATMLAVTAARYPAKPIA
jgi:CRP-like cAMP-binding protein